MRENKTVITYGLKAGATTGLQKLRNQILKSDEPMQTQETHVL